MGDEPFPFILAGGIFRAVPWLREEMQRRLPLAVPNGTRAAARTRAGRRRRVVRDPGSARRRANPEVSVREIAERQVRPVIVDLSR